MGIWLKYRAVKEKPGQQVSAEGARGSCVWERSEPWCLYLSGSSGDAEEVQEMEDTWYIGLETASILFLTQESLNKDSYLFP